MDSLPLGKSLSRFFRVAAREITPGKQMCVSANDCTEWAQTVEALTADLSAAQAQVQRVREALHNNRLLLCTDADCDRSARRVAADIRAALDGPAEPPAQQLPAPGPVDDWKWAATDAAVLVARDRILEANGSVHWHAPWGKSSWWSVVAEDGATTDALVCPDGHAAALERLADFAADHRELGEGGKVWPVAVDGAIDAARAAQAQGQRDGEEATPGE